MISGRQIRAACALAGWEGRDLAEAVGITPMSVSNLVRGIFHPKDSTTEKIIKVFSDMGIEFTENNGVRERPKGIDVYEGRDRFHAFTEFVHEYLVNFGGDVCISAVDETQFRKYRRDFELYKQRMAELVGGGKVTVRILATESSFKSSWAQYRYQPAEDHTPTAFYAFGDNLAMISFDGARPPYVVLHKASPFAKAYIESFNRSWAAAQEPPK